MADIPEHPTTIAETQQQFLARAILARGPAVGEATAPVDWTPADEARLQALANGTGY